MLTNDELAEIERRSNAATMRLWREFLGDKVDPNTTDCYVIGNTVVILPPGDAALIANAPADIAALIAEVRRLQAELVESEGYCGVLQDECSGYALERAQERWHDIKKLRQSKAATNSDITPV